MGRVLVLDRHKAHMLQYTYIKHLEATPSIEQVFLIADVTQRYGTKGSKPFLILTLKDLTGTIKCYVFDQKLIQPLEVGKFVLIRGRIEVVSGDLQVVAKEWQPVAEPPDNLGDYVICPNPNVLKAYRQILQGFIDHIEDPDIRNIVGNAVSGKMSILDRMEVAPFGTNGPLSYRGGLLFHTACLTRTSIAMIDSFSDCQHGLNKDVIIAGALLRNFGWFAGTTAKGDIFQANEINDSLGIRFICGMVVNHICISTESDLRINLPLSKKLALQQIAIASKDTPNLSREGRLILQAEDVVACTDIRI